MPCPLGRLKKVEATKQWRPGGHLALRGRGDHAEPDPRFDCLLVAAICAVAPRRAHRAATRGCWSGS